MQGWILFTPFVSAAAGWLLARAAGILLFHPLKPKKFAGVRLHGLVPASIPRLSREVGNWAGREFLSPAMLSEKLAGDGAFQKIRPAVEHHIDQFLRVNLARKMPVIGFFIGDKTIGQLKSVFMEELEQLFPVVMQQYADKLTGELDPIGLITEKLNAIPPAAIESAIRNQMPGLFRMLGFAGATIGFTCGWLQILIWLIAK